MNNLSMTVLVDNISRDDLGAEWGLSILIRADDKKILLDTGASGLFADNAKKLGISLADVDFGVLSHQGRDEIAGHCCGRVWDGAARALAPFLPYP